MKKLIIIASLLVSANVFASGVGENQDTVCSKSAQSGRFQEGIQEGSDGQENQPKPSSVLEV